MRRRFKAGLAAALVAAATATGTAFAKAGVFDTVSASSQSADITVRFGTHNVQHARTTRIGPFAGVIGWQEMNNWSERRKMRNKLPDYAHYVPGPGPAKANPISWRKDRFRSLRRGYVKTHGGTAGETPARYISWVKLESKTGKRFLVLNTHFISGAWTRHPDRQARWLRHAGKLRDLIRRVGRNHPNSPIVVMGDFNRRKKIWLPRNVEYIWVKNVRGVPIDQMYAQKRKLTRHSMVERLSKRGSDHHAYRFTAKF